MKQNKVIFGIALSTVAIVIMIFINFYFQDIARKEIRSNLIDSIEQLENRQVEYIDFMQITSFSWDRLYIFTPYTNYKTIDETLGFYWLPARSSLIQSKDYVYLLVFLKNRHVVQYVEFYSNEGNFDLAYKETGYLPNNSRFELKDDKFLVWLPTP